MSEIEVEFELDKSTLKEAVQHLQRTFILHALKETNGNKSKAAKLLGMNRTTMIMMIKRLGSDNLAH